MNVCNDNSFLFEDLRQNFHRFINRTVWILDSSDKGEDVDETRLKQCIDYFNSLVSFIEEGEFNFFEFISPRAHHLAPASNTIEREQIQDVVARLRQLVAMLGHILQNGGKEVDITGTAEDLDYITEILL